MKQTRKTIIRGKVVWWLHPVTVFAGLNALIGIAAWLVSPATYLQAWRTPKYFSASTALLTAAAITAFVAGAWLSQAQWPRHVQEPEWRGTVPLSQAMLLFKISFWACIIGYAFWTGFAISRGVGLDLLRSAFTGGAVDVVTLKTDFLETVPGITTFTQFGIPAVVLGCLIGTGVGWRIVWRKLAIVFFLALVRALLFSERLAFLELAVPFIVCHMGQAPPWTRRPLLRTLIRFAPALGAVALLLLFVGFEYFRSWSNYYSSTESSLLQFGSWRLLGYYATSLNNTAYLLSSIHQPLGAPYFSFSFLWRFPNSLIGAIFPWVHLNFDSYMDLLQYGANPEFNNPGGLLSPVIDFGAVGALAYWATMGLLTGFCYRLLLRKHPLGLCMYPVIYLALTETPRFIYWGTGRAFPALVYLLVSAILLRRWAAQYRPLRRRGIPGNSAPVPERVFSG